MKTQHIQKIKIKNDDYTSQKVKHDEIRVFGTSNGFRLNTKVVGHNKTYLLNPKICNFFEVSKIPLIFLKSELGLSKCQLGLKPLETSQNYPNTVITR